MSQNTETPIMNAAEGWNDRRDLLAQIGILERQLSEVRAQLAESDAAHKATCEIMERHAAISHGYRKQRDRLAQALRNLMSVIDSHDIQTEDCDRRGNLYCDCLHRARKPALEALAALNQPGETKP